MPHTPMLSELPKCMTVAFKSITEQMHHNILEHEDVWVAEVGMDSVPLQVSRLIAPVNLDLQIRN